MHEFAYIMLVHYFYIYDHYPVNGWRVAAVLHTEVPVQFSTAL